MDRFEAKVDRSGDHHVRIGAKETGGTGVLEVAGKLAPPHRAA